MGDVIELKPKENKEEVVSIRDTIIKSLEVLDREEIDCGIVLLRKTNGEAISGYFSTSFQDEAVLSKVLDLDVLARQQQREIMD